MRVVELMKRRCRRVLEWAAAVTVPCNSFSLYFKTQNTSPLLGCSSPEKMLKRRKMKSVTWGWGTGGEIGTAGAVTGEMRILGEKERETSRGPRRTPISLTTTASTLSSD